MSENAIEIKDLVKKFGDFTAVDGASFTVKRGELFAFLGVNGAGKSTTINIICGTLPRNGGSVTVDGMDIDKDLQKIKSKLGVVFQGSVLDRVLTVKENIKSRAALYGIFGAEFEKRYNELNELLGLKELEGRAVGKLSGGQRRRADIARALVHNPSILILDEPTTGLDPQTRKTVWHVIADLRKRNDMTVLLTTHYMEEATDADDVVIIDCGKVVASGTPVELKNKYTGDFITFYTDEIDLTKIQELGGGKAEKVSGGYRIEIENTAKATELIRKHPELFIDYEISKGKMDDVFLNATGKHIGD